MKCKKCHSSNLAFLEGKKTHRKEKLITLLFMLIFFVLGVCTYEKLLIVWAILMSITLVTLMVFMFVDKSNRHRTFTKVVCKNCGNVTWLKD